MRYALRQLTEDTPGFTATAVVTLAMAIRATRPLYEVKGVDGAVLLTAIVALAASLAG